MSMRKTRTFISFAALSLLSTSVLASSSSSSAPRARAPDPASDQARNAGMKTTSPQKNEEQIHSKWCWNASVRNLIYTESGGSIDARQCKIANYAFGLNYTCKFDHTFAWKDDANGGNWNRKPAGAAYKDNFEILKHYGFKKLKYQLGALRFEDVRRSIDRNHGVLTHWRWKQGGGHVVVAYGYHVRPDGSQWVMLADPWPGEGDYWRNYKAYVKSNRYTTSSTIRVVD